MNKTDIIFITGGNGMLGRALVCELKAQGYSRILYPGSAELNITDSLAVVDFLKKSKPQFIFHLASLVYGLKGNMNHQMQSLVENTKIYSNILKCSDQADPPQKIFFAGTVASYGYPYVRQPLQEEDLFVGLPHGGEFGYAMAKRHAFSYLSVAKEVYGVDYIYGLFTNLFGEHDTFNTETGHVIPSLIKKAVAASSGGRNSFEVWGNQSTTRDFMYIRDAARSAIFLMKNGSGIYNISSGIGRSMGELASAISNSLGGSVKPVWNASEPVGISNRVVSNDKINRLGFCDYTPFEDAIKKTVSWYTGDIN